MTDDGHEPLWLLKAISYSEYRQSAWWRARRDSYIATTIAANGCKACELCGIEDGSIAAANGEDSDGIYVRYHVHHRNYARLGAESDHDLALLCSMCHNLVHFPESVAAKFWADHAHRTISYKVYGELTGRWTSLP